METVWFAVARILATAKKKDVNIPSFGIYDWEEGILIDMD